MTIRELYQWAEEHAALDLDVEIQYRDDGGLYFGTEPLNDFVPVSIDDRNSEFPNHTEKVVIL